MSRWLAVILIAGMMLGSDAARAQAPTTLSTLQIQLWPEYDQPSMLVIYDFQVGDAVQLPSNVTLRLPAEANLVAVAYYGDEDSLWNADYSEAAASDDWQSVVVHVQNQVTYRIEYFQPFERSGDQRLFSFQWPGDYAVRDFSMIARMPADATGISSTPELQRSADQGSTFLMEAEFGPLPVNEAFDFSMEWSRSSDSLVAPSGGLQPSQPLDGTTPGRVMLSEWLPVILGVLGVALVGGGGLYFWQSSRARTPARRRHVARSTKASRQDSDVYCHQCGTRAQEGDRFCRVCGTRLRTPD